MGLPGSFPARFWHVQNFPEVRDGRSSSRNSFVRDRGYERISGLTVVGAGGEQRSLLDFEATRQPRILLGGLAGGAMFFFFFGGVQPEVSKVIESSVTECPRCRSDASLVEYDVVFRAFFIPVWRWSGWNPAIHCNTCSFLLPLEQFQKRHISYLPPPQSEPSANQAKDYYSPSAPTLCCWSCSSLLQPDFHFCPQCGASQQ